nr:uncharacterized mitochondrial protein AtMg00810-like [Tanacetum cinerariifolium]
MGLWYTKDSGFELTGFSDADYARCKDTIKSSFGGAQFLSEKYRSKQSELTTILYSPQLVSEPHGSRSRIYKVFEEALKP